MYLNHNFFFVFLKTLICSFSRINFKIVLNFDSYVHEKQTKFTVYTSFNFLINFYLL